MLRVWGRATSSNVMKVIWLLEELKLPYERLDVGGPFGKTDTPEYRAMNPTGLVPTLDDGGFILWESNAILRYIIAAYAPDHPVFPADTKTRANIDHWMDFQQTTLNRPQTVIFLGMVRTKPEDRDNAAIARAVGEAGRAWAIIDAALAGHPFIAGAHLTLADMVFGMHVHRWFVMPIDRPALPHLRAWYDHLMTLPIFAEHCAIALV
jgi:glutathione S-transferase